MNKHYEYDTVCGELYLAGERVSPGCYREIGGRREIYLEEYDVLPASLDGRVACYERIENAELRTPPARQNEIQHAVRA